MPSTEWPPAATIRRIHAFLWSRCLLSTPYIITPWCLCLREQCLRSTKTPVAVVAHVVLLRSISGNVEVKTLAFKRSEVIGNAVIVRKRRVIHNKSKCVCLRLPVVGIYAKTQEHTYLTFRNYRLALGYCVPRDAQKCGLRMIILSSSWSPLSLLPTLPWRRTLFTFICQVQISVLSNFSQCNQFIRSLL